MHWEALLSASWQASTHAGTQGVFCGGSPLLLSPPQHWHLVSLACPDLLLGSLCCGFPLPNPLHIALSTCDTLLPNPSGCLCTANPTNCFLVSQAVSTSPTAALFQELTSRAKVLVPSPHPSASVFGDCASSSDDLFSSLSAFQISDLLLRFSWGLEISPTQLKFPSIR